MKNIVFYSGGLGSFSTAVYLKQNSFDNIFLLFADTLWEHDSLYEFIEETASKLDLPLIKVSDGRSVPDLMREQNFLFNSRVANCSKQLKAKVCKKYIEHHFKDEEVNLYFGIDYTEVHRIPAIKKNWSKYNCFFPLVDNPINAKEELIKLGIELPLLYKLGFSHNNCGGRCIKGGVKHFTNLKEKLPENFEELANLEEEIGKGKYTILKNKSLRAAVSDYQLKKENKQTTIQEDFDIGGCGCFTDAEEAGL